jgi:hypothetical protein
VNRRPVLASTAALAALTLAAASGTASGATATAAAGSASSSLTLLRVLAAGHDLSAGTLVLRSDTTTSPRISRVEVTPVTVDGTAYGRQVVDQSSSPKSVGAQSSPSALASLVSLSSPGMGISATNDPSNQVGTSSLGGLKVLGLPISLGGALQTTSAVSGTSGASAGKTITLTNLALPSVADLLAALGLDLSKLPIGSLTSLLSQLNLVTSTVTTAQNAVNTAQSAVNAQQATVTGLLGTLTTDQGLLATAQTTLTSATSALQTQLSNPLVTALPGVSLLTGGLALTVAQFETLVSASDPLVALIEAIPVVGPAITSAQTSYLSALSGVSAAQLVVNTAQAAVNAAQALLTTLTSTLTSTLTTLLGAVTGVLDGTPLLSLAKLQLSTRSAVVSATSGGQTAEIVGGTISGLKVLGTDVLKTALGSSTVDLTGLVGSAVTKLTSTIGGLTGTFSSVLSGISSLPLLSIPVPQIGVLTRSASTSIAGGFGHAATTVTGLSITIPAITLPTSVALPGASSLPALGGVTQVAGKLTSAPVTLSLLSLGDQAAFRPATIGGGSTAGAPGTPGAPGSSSTSGGLPRTGLPVGVVALALTLLGGAFVVRRRFLTES